MRNCQTIVDKMGLSRRHLFLSRFVPILSDNGQADKSRTKWDINDSRGLAGGLSRFVRPFVRIWGKGASRTKLVPPLKGGQSLSLSPRGRFPLSVRWRD